jgi:hypothetical protein
MKNITYLFGAGASYNACPIWKEQGDKMIELSNILGYNFDYYNDELDSFNDDIERLIWHIGLIGFKSKEFNTVDTYARKLYLIKDYNGLRMLKKAVSIFFTLWSLTNDMKWKELLDSKENPKIRVYDIDPRYINLLATYLEHGDSNPKLQSNIKFVSWNYDLQLESAFNKFCGFGGFNFISVDKYFPFIPVKNEDKELDVCHLNGFHGFYGKGSGENLFKRSESKDLKDLLKSIDFVNKPDFKGLAFSEYINYAWETESELAKVARLKAIDIFSKTNTLVVVGYSFPPFNHEIDRQLFDNNNKLERIIIQDPRADAKYIAETFGIPIENIDVITDNMEQFVIPNYKEKEIFSMT